MHFSPKGMVGDGDGEIGEHIQCGGDIERGDRN